MLEDGIKENPKTESTRTLHFYAVSRPVEKREHQRLTQNPGPTSGLAKVVHEM